MASYDDERSWDELVERSPSLCEEARYPEAESEIGESRTDASNQEFIRLWGSSGYPHVAPDSLGTQLSASPIRLGWRLRSVVTQLLSNPSP